MLNTNNKRKIHQISKSIDDTDDVEKGLKQTYFIPKRVRFDTTPTEINEKSNTLYTTNVITHVTIDTSQKEKKSELEKKFESLTLSSAQVLLDCAQSLLETINKRIEKTKEYIDLHYFNPDYCVDSSILTLFKEIEQIKEFQTKVNKLLIEFNSLR